MWDEVSTDIKNEFDSEPVYNKNFLKNNIISRSRSYRFLR